MSWKLPEHYKKSVSPDSPSQPFIHMGLTPRLAALACHVEPNSRIVDVGTDHGLLPIGLVASQRASFAIAVDQRSMPLDIARKNVSKSGVQDKLELRLGDGFSTLQANEVDTAIVAGMSGEHMADILTRHDLKALGIQKLIVQPNTNLSVFRQKMTGAGWEITDEAFVACGRRYYVIMVLKPSNLVSPLTFEQATLGPILSQSSGHPLYRLWVQLMKDRYSQKIQGYHAGNQVDAPGLEIAEKCWNLFRQA